MFKVTKILMLLWLLFCGAIGMLSIVGGGAASASAMESNTVEMMMEEQPELTREEAETMVAAGDAGAVLGGSVAAGVGVVGAGVLWFVGMIPLLVMYLVFKPSGTTVQVQQVIGEMPAQQSSTRHEG